jgi:predicted nucleic acid-binding protein
MVVIDASALVNALLVDGHARSRLAAESLQAPELIDAELLSVLRRLVLAEQLEAPLLTADARLARAPGLRCSVELIEASMLKRPPKGPRAGAQG